MPSQSAFSYPNSPYDAPDFEQGTTQKLTYYMVVSQKCLNKLGPRHRRENLTQKWEAIRRNWSSNPANPSVFPAEKLTLQVVNDFYSKCDSLCIMEPRTNDVDELIRAYFASCSGAQFIINSLLIGPRHPLAFKIQNKADRLSVLAFRTPEEIRNMAGDGHAADSSSQRKISLGDVLRYQEQGRMCSIRVKDHGNTAMKGEFFVVTSIIDENQDDSSQDKELALDELETILQHSVVDHNA